MSKRWRNYEWDIGFLVACGSLGMTRESPGRKRERVKQPGMAFGTDVWLE